jgi:hypothetical protein
MQLAMSRAYLDGAVFPSELMVKSESKQRESLQMAVMIVVLGSVVGFGLAGASLVLGAGLGSALLVWSAAGLLSAVIFLMMAMAKPQDDAATLTQSA